MSDASLLYPARPSSEQATDLTVGQWNRSGGGWLPGCCAFGMAIAQSSPHLLHQSSCRFERAFGVPHFGCDQARIKHSCSLGAAFLSTPYMFAFNSSKLNQIHTIRILKRELYVSLTKSRLDLVGDSLSLNILRKECSQEKAQAVFVIWLRRT